jgi:hypothetical protein
MIRTNHWTNIYNKLSALNDDMYLITGVELLPEEKSTLFGRTYPTEIRLHILVNQMMIIISSL